MCVVTLGLTDLGVTVADKTKLVHSTWQYTKFPFECLSSLLNVEGETFLEAKNDKT